MEDSETMTTEIYLRADRTIILGVTDGPRHMRGGGSWDEHLATTADDASSPRTFDMTLVRTYLGGNVSSGASVQGGALRACPRISAFHGPLRAVPEAVHLGTFERAVVHSALVDHSFSPLSSRVLAFASHSATRVAIVEIVRVEKYSRVSVRSRSSRRSGRQKLMDRRFSSSASGCCVRRRFVATFGRLNHRDLRVFVGCHVDRAHRVPIQPWSLR